MKHLQAVCFLCAWSAMLFSAPQDKETENGNRIAVLDIQGRGISRPEAETITNYMRIEVAATGSVTSVDGSQIREVLSDMGLEETGCASPECALEAGTLLAASHVVIGSVIKAEQSYDLDFRMFNIETGSVQNTVKQTYQGDVDELIIALQRLVWDIMDLTPPPERFPEEKQVRGPVFVTFTSGDWNIPKTITIYGDETYTIVTGPVVSDDTIYNTIEPADVYVTNADDDVAGITVAPVAGLKTTEAGGVDTFTVVLTSEPTADVALSVSSSHTTEGRVSPTLLVFNAGNWNTLQTVTVTGVADTVDDGDQTYTIVVESAVSSDPDYAGSDPQDVSVINYDNQPGIIVYPTTALTTTEAGGHTSFTVLLTSQPSAELAFSFVSSEPAEGRISSPPITFTRDDWNTPRTVTITGVDDDVADGDQAYTIVVGVVVSNGSNYIGLDPDDVSVTNIDDDEAGIIVEPVSKLTTTEAGSLAAFTVVLSSEPTADVKLSFSTSDATEASLWPPPGHQEPEEPVADRPVRRKGWLAAHRGVVWAALAVAGGASVWALVGEEEETVGKPPAFPVVP